MANYAIGDVQGCFDALITLLKKIKFDSHSDKLWFVGDLVNRGQHSLSVLRFVQDLPIKPNITLGNHDLYLLMRLFCKQEKFHSDDTLQAILSAEDRDSLGHWLRKQSILIHDTDLNVVMCHAGIAPMWSLTEAKRHARELEQSLQGENYITFFQTMYGNEPAIWNNGLTGTARLRTICNYFTRMRFCTADGGLDFTYKGTIKDAPPHLVPWYAWPKRKEIKPDLVFGHWAALGGKCPHPRIYAIDTGCLWGGQLTALRLEDRKRFSV